MPWLGIRAITARSRGVSCSDVGVFIVRELSAHLVMVDEISTADIGEEGGR
jgi:hypothetical protein